MSQELALQNQLPTSDGWEDTAAEASSRTIQGTLLKFTDGSWKVGREAEAMEGGRRFLALATTSAWVKWQGGKPVEYKLREAGKFLPDRGDLGDEDSTLWEKGPDNLPKDPWQHTAFLYLIDETTAEPFTFSTSSWGGRGSVSDLAMAIKNKRYREPGAQPVVELESAPFKTKFGMKTSRVSQSSAGTQTTRQPRRTKRCRWCCRRRPRSPRRILTTRFHTDNSIQAEGLNGRDSSGGECATRWRTRLGQAWDGGVSL